MMIRFLSYALVLYLGAGLHAGFSLRAADPYTPLSDVGIRTLTWGYYAYCGEDGSSCAALHARVSGYLPNLAGSE